MEIKREYSRSWIDFNAVTKPSQKKLVISSSADQSVIIYPLKIIRSLLIVLTRRRFAWLLQTVKQWGHKLSVPAAAPLRHKSMFPITGKVHTEYIVYIPALTIGGVSATASISPCGNNSPPLLQLHLQVHHHYYLSAMVIPVRLVHKSCKVLDRCSLLLFDFVLYYLSACLP